MSNAKARTAEPPKSFDELGACAKVVFIGKVLVFLATFGFAFPTILGD